MATTSGLRSWRRTDGGLRLGSSLLASLMEYVLVAQDEARVEVYRKATGWELEVYGAGQRFRLDSIDAELGVDEIYWSIDLSASD